MQQRIEFRTNELKMSTQLNAQYIQWLNVYFYCWTLRLGDIPCHTWSMRTFNIQPNLLFISSRKRGYPNHNNHFKGNQSEWRREQIYYWLFISSSFSTLYMSIHTYNNHCRASGIKKISKIKRMMIVTITIRNHDFLFSLHIPNNSREVYTYKLSGMPSISYYDNDDRTVFVSLNQSTIWNVCVYTIHIRFILHDPHLLIHDVT